MQEAARRLRRPRNGLRCKTIARLPGFPASVVMPQLCRVELERLIAEAPADLTALDRLTQLAEKVGETARAAESAPQEGRSRCRSRSLPETQRPGPSHARCGRTGRSGRTAWQPVPVASFSQPGDRGKQLSLMGDGSVCQFLADRCVPVWDGAIPGRPPGCGPAPGVVARSSSRPRTLPTLVSLNSGRVIGKSDLEREDMLTVEVLVPKQLKSSGLVSDIEAGVGLAWPASVDNGR